MVWVAYFAPYSYEQHQSLVAACQRARDPARDTPLFHVASTGQSLDGRDIDMVRFGTGDAQCWIVARQHPGETMAEWWAQGLLTRLMECDAVVRRLGEMA